MLLILAVFVASCTAAPLWGQTGHTTIATIAQALLNSHATQQVLKLLPDNDGQLAQIANWADEVKYTPAYEWSKALHYINTPAWACDYDRSRDCISYGVANFCVDTAVQNYTARVQNASLPFDQQNEALKFLTHFVGDIHQPLHVGFLQDQGGNTIYGYFLNFTNSTSLHEIWDTYIIDALVLSQFGGNFSALPDYLLQQIQSGAYESDVGQWLECADSTPDNACSPEWAMESVGFACNYSYVEADGVTHIANNFELESDYYYRNYPIVELQLAKGGVRLANVLNQIWP
jgi:hypothetical protein